MVVSGVSVQAFYWYLGLGHGQPATAQPAAAAPLLTAMSPPLIQPHWSHTLHTWTLHTITMSHCLQPDIRTFAPNWHHQLLTITCPHTPVPVRSLRMSCFWLFSCFRVASGHETWHTRHCPAPCLTGLLSTRPSQRALVTSVRVTHTPTKKSTYFSQDMDFIAYISFLLTIESFPGVYHRRISSKTSPCPIWGGRLEDRRECCM